MNKEHEDVFNDATTKLAKNILQLSDKTIYNVPDDIWQKIQDIKNYMIMNNFKTLGPIKLR